MEEKALVMDFEFNHDTEMQNQIPLNGKLETEPKPSDISSGIDRGNPQFFDICLKLTSSGRADEAIKLLRECWEADPEDCAAGHVLTMALVMEGDRKGALEENDKVLARFPYFVPAYCQRTRILLAMKRRREALASARTAVRLSPKDF